MRTTHILTVSTSMLCTRGMSAPGGVYLVPGVSALGGVPGPGGVYLVWGGVPGPGGCTWSQGVSAPRGVSGTPP